MAAVILGYRSLNLPHALRAAAATSKSIQKLKTLKFNQRFSRISSVTLAGCGGIFAMYLWNDSADCASNNDKNRNITFPSDPVEFFQKYYQQYSDQINQLGFSGFAGAFSGYAFKRISKEIAFAIGGVFMFLQGLSYLGYININYKKLEDDATKKLDQNGDGKLDFEDAKVAWNNISNILSFGLPSASGFASGFAMGFYYG